VDQLYVQRDHASILAAGLTTTEPSDQRLLFGVTEVPCQNQPCGFLAKVLGNLKQD
jgi:hypothetical protein